MRTLDRLGVHIDQCESCRGIFLDRGELEQIAAAEQQHYSAAPPSYQPEPYAVHGSRPDSPPPFRQEHPRRYPDSPKPYGGHYQDSPRPYGHGGHKRKRGGFLENLFD
jgi:uncharacterized protein